MTNREKIIDYLHKHPEGADDDELSRALNIYPRQQVNAICRQLVKEGIIERDDSQGKIRNYLKRSESDVARPVDARGSKTTGSNINKESMSTGAEVANIFLITCVKTKQAMRSPASELYSSPNFRKLKALANKRADKWYILSAKYGLLEPDQVIDPYELTLNDMSKAERMKWASGVLRQLTKVIVPGDRITILAGQKYWGELKPLLEEYGCEVLTPLKGVTQFKWGAWLNRELADD